MQGGVSLKWGCSTDIIQNAYTFAILLTSHSKLLFFLLHFSLRGKMKNRKNKVPISSLKVFLGNAHNFFTAWDLLYCINANVKL